jgi:hypothetical protein
MELRCCQGGAGLVHGQKVVTEPVNGVTEPVNGFQILDRVATLPVSTWRYNWEPPHVRHVGPMAQDWKATFGLGEHDSLIDMIDANGVTLVSIQALRRLVVDLRQKMDDLAQQLAELTASRQSP